MDLGDRYEGQATISIATAAARTQKAINRERRIGKWNVVQKSTSRVGDD